MPFCKGRSSIRGRRQANARRGESTNPRSGFHLEEISSKVTWISSVPDGFHCFCFLFTRSPPPLCGAPSRREPIQLKNTDHFVVTRSPPPLCGAPSRREPIQQKNAALADDVFSYVAYRSEFIRINICVYS